MFVSTNDLQTARRNAKRKRAFAACVSCKSAKTQCSDYRPCKRCTDSRKAGDCVDQNEKNQKKAYRFDMTSPASCSRYSQDANSGISASVSALDCLQNAVVQDGNSQQSVSRSASNDFVSLVPIPNIEGLGQKLTAAQQCSASWARPLHVFHPLPNPTGKSAQSAQPTLGDITCSHAAKSGLNPVSSRSFNNLEPMLQSENSLHDTGLPFASQPDAITTGAPKSELSISMPKHQQTTALKCYPFSSSFQPTNGSHLHSTVPPTGGLSFKLRSEPGRMSPPALAT